MKQISHPPRAVDLMLVEDTPSLQMLYRTVLRKAGYPAVCASTGEDALEQFATHKPKVVLLDLMLPDRDGLSVMSDMLRQQPGTRVIVISANGAISNAVEATRRGAHDFLVKPLGDTRLVGAVASAMSDCRREAQRLTPVPTDLLTAGDGVFQGNSAAIVRVRAQVEAVAGSMAPVVIQGESGTGRFACAELIHASSPRARERLVTVNCRGVTPGHLWDELFGKGGDAPRTRGALARALGGSLLLLEPQDMPAEVQAGLLQVLREGQFPTGTGDDAQAFDFRLISVVQNDLFEAQRAGRMCEDLCYRLAVLSIDMPPLRDRIDDIGLLTEQYLKSVAQQEGKAFERLAPDVVPALAAREWRGNLRELTNVLRQAIVLNDGQELTGSMLPHAPAGKAQPAQPQDSTLPVLDALAGLTMAEIERKVIEAAIERHGGSIPQAARELDIAPSTIYRKRDVWDAQDR